MLKRKRPTARSKTKPLLESYGITPEQFQARYRVVVCPICKKRGIARFLFLHYLNSTPGESPTSVCFRGIPKPGLNSCDHDHEIEVDEAGVIRATARECDG